VFYPVSVDAFRKFIAKFGTYIFALMFVAFAVSFISSGSKCNTVQDESLQADQGPAFASIGKFNATIMEVDQLANNNAASASSFSPDTVAQSYASQTANVMDHLFNLALASDKGIVMDDKAVEEAIPSLWQGQLDTYRSRLVQAGKIKPTATDAEFSVAFNQALGISVDQQKQQFTDDFHKAFSDPARKELIRSEVAMQQLTQKYSAIGAPTDDELKNSFGSYKVQQLTVVNKPGVDPKEVANQALAAIKGGMSFEDAIKKYSNDTPVKGKSLTDPQDVNSFMFEISPAYRVLLDLKQGDVSGVVDAGQGNSFMIFKVVKFTPNVPPDFETKKADARKSMQQMAAQMAMQQDLSALKSSGKIEWKSAAFKAIYDYENAQSAPSNKDAALRAVQADAKKALDTDKDNSRIAALAYYISTKDLYDAATPDQKKSLLQDRIASIEDVLQTAESPETRLQLVDLYLQSNRPADAALQMVATAKSLTGGSAQALGTYETFLARYEKLKATNQLAADKKKEIDEALSNWKKAMLDEQKIRLDQLAQQDKLQKENEALIAKQKAIDDAAARKAAAEKAKNPSKPAPTSTTKPSAPTTSPTGSFVPLKPTGK
jgi:hypothetical protein